MIAAEEKRKFIEDHLQKEFTIEEHNDEFLGTSDKIIRSSALFSKPFLDKDLKIDYKSFNGELSDDVPRISKAESDTIEDFVKGGMDELVTALVKIDGTDTVEPSKRLISIGKSYLQKAKCCLCILIEREGKKRGKVVCSLEQETDNGHNSFQLIFTVESASDSRKYGNFDVHVITPSGQHMSFTGKKVDGKSSSRKQLKRIDFSRPSDSYNISLDESTDEGHIPFFKDYLTKETGFFPSAWNNFSYYQYTYSDEFIIPLSEEQVNQMLVSGTKFSVRFEGYDVRGEFGSDADNVKDKIGFLNGDDSHVDGLYEKYVHEDEEVAKQQAEEKRKQEGLLEVVNFLLRNSYCMIANKKDIYIIPNPYEKVKYLTDNTFHPESAEERAKLEEYTYLCIQKLITCSVISTPYKDDGTQKRIAEKSSTILFRNKEFYKDISTEGFCLLSDPNQIADRLNLDSVQRGRLDSLTNGWRPVYKDDMDAELRLLKSGCYVATCVYGSYDCPQVWTLRRWRDNTLDRTWVGRLFIKIYYAVSPTIVRWFGRSEIFKSFWRRPLDRMVEALREKGVEDTPYHDKY